MPPGTGVAVQVTQAGGFAAMESPDGASLYYTKHDRPGIWRRPVNGEGEEEQVLEAVSNKDWGNWAVVEEGLYFVQRKEGRARVSFYSFATAQTSDVLMPDQDIPWMDPALAISRDGHWVLYGQVGRRESDLMLVEPFR